MSGGITLTALASYAAIAGAAVSIGSSIYSAVSAPSGAATGGAPQADATQANNQIGAATQSNAAARAQLLETAGASAGSPLVL